MVQNFKKNCFRKWCLVGAGGRGILFVGCSSLRLFQLLRHIDVWHPIWPFSLRHNQRICSHACECVNAWNGCWMLVHTTQKHSNKKIQKSGTNGLAALRGGWWTYEWGGGRWCERQNFCTHLPGCHPLGERLLISPDGWVQETLPIHSNPGHTSKATISSVFSTSFSRRASATSNSSFFFSKSSFSVWRHNVNAWVTAASAAAKKKNTQKIVIFLFSDC